MVEGAARGAWLYLGRFANSETGNMLLSWYVTGSDYGVRGHCRGPSVLIGTDYGARSQCGGPSLISWYCGYLFPQSVLIAIDTVHLKIVNFVFVSVARIFGIRRG